MTGANNFHRTPGIGTKQNSHVMRLLPLLLSARLSMHAEQRRQNLTDIQPAMSITNAIHMQTSCCSLALTLSVSLCRFVSAEISLRNVEG